jgi:tRNA U34 5-methylaminomethyl-2-thiouridine-forming methyltransferase MnmC
MSNPIQIISTADGSHSLLNIELNETYHSIHGAVQESMHVFISNGFDFFCQRFLTDPVKILEIGFGTGLNVWLTAEQSLKTGRMVHYTSLEIFPLPEEIWSKLNYAGSPEERMLFENIHKAPWETEILLHANFTLRKVVCAVQDFQSELSTFNLVYFDAFAPGKQPELWHFDILKKVADAMSSNSVLVTYCAKGQVRRDLRSLNLIVESLQGPPGKKEMTRVLKI